MRLVVLLSVLAIPALAEDIVVEQEFAPQEVVVTPAGGQHTVTLAEGLLGQDAPGKPDLPARVINVAIPRGARGIAVSATIVEQLIGRDILVRPSQPPTPPGQIAVVVPPDPQAYALDAIVPLEPVTITGTHHMRGRTYVSLLLRPVRYNAARKELHLITRMTITLSVARGAAAKGQGKAQEPGVDRVEPRRGNQEFDRLFRRMVVNPGFDDQAPAPVEEKVPVPAPAPKPSGAVPAAGEKYFLSASSYSVSEAAGTVQIGIESSKPTTATIQYATANGTALAGSDYTATGGTVGFSGAQRVFVNVPLINNTSAEGSETFTFTISNPSEGDLNQPTTATITITDDDNPGSLRFSSTGFSAAENAGSLQLTVSRVGGGTGAVGIAYATANGNGTAGSDYTSTSGTLTWADGDAGDKTITVPLLDDALAEGSETFTVTLSAPTGGATLGSPSSATATIVDDEGNPNAADYLIITNDALKPAFQVLADYRANTHGIVTKVVTVGYILSAYPGADDQQKIRNFIKACVADSGTQYVVLGGDSSVVKDRDCYVTCSGYTQADMPTDLYYAGLDGTWDSDGDGTYGEAGQDTDVDMAIDVMVARIPVQTAAQAANYINKVIAYDLNP